MTEYTGSLTIEDRYEATVTRAQLETFLPRYAHNHVTATIITDLVQVINENPEVFQVSREGLISVAQAIVWMPQPLNSEQHVQAVDRLLGLLRHTKWTGSQIFDCHLQGELSRRLSRTEVPVQSIRGFRPRISGDVTAR